MQEHRYSLGLLELAFGANMLLIALYITLTQRPDSPQIWRFLLTAVGIPLIFWVTREVEKRLLRRANLATFILARRNLLIALVFCLFAVVIPVSLYPKNPSTMPIAIAAIASGGIVFVRGTGPRVAYLVSGILLLGLGLAVLAPAAVAGVLFCIILALVLIPAGVVTLRRELRR